MLPYIANNLHPYQPGTPSAMASGILLYPDPQHRQLAARFVNAAGKTYDLAGEVWADNPTAYLVPLHPIVAPDVSGWQVCTVPSFPTNSGPVAIFVHPLAGGPPVDAPFPLSTPGPATLFGVAFGV